VAKTGKKRPSGRKLTEFGQREREDDRGRLDFTDYAPDLTLEDEYFGGFCETDDGEQAPRPRPPKGAPLLSRDVSGDGSPGGDGAYFRRRPSLRVPPFGAAFGDGRMQTFSGFAIGFATVGLPARLRGIAPRNDGPPSGHLMGRIHSLSRRGDMKKSTLGQGTRTGSESLSGQLILIQFTIATRT
jgi:hypothetical protein